MRELQKTGFGGRLAFAGGAWCCSTQHTADLAGYRFRAGAWLRILRYESLQLRHVLLSPPALPRKQARLRTEHVRHVLAGGRISGTQSSRWLPEVRRKPFSFEKGNTTILRSCENSELLGNKGRELQITGSNPPTESSSTAIDPEEGDDFEANAEEAELLAAAAAAPPEVAAATLRRKVRARARTARLQRDIEGTDHARRYRITTYCTAKEYDMVRALRRMRVWSNNQAGLVDDSLVIHARPRRAAMVSEDDAAEEPGDVFIFRYGVVVMWHLDPEEERHLLTIIRSFCERDGLDEPESDDFAYEISGDQPRFVSDILMMPDASVLAKLAASHGMAQSIKLSSFEESVQRSVEATRDLAAELAATGAIVSRSRRDIAMTLGSLVMDRHILYLFADVLDPPDIIWNHPEYDSLYRLVERYLELPQRVEMLNKRVDVVRELLNLLSSELQFRHSSRLEVIIIVLIMLELIIALGKEVVPLIAGTARHNRFWILVFLAIFVAGLLVTLAALMAENLFTFPHKKRDHDRFLAKPFRPLAEIENYRALRFQSTTPPPRPGR
jgi:uncharacterized Rmd1/YagE family protein